MNGFDKIILTAAIGAGLYVAAQIPRTGHPMLTKLKKYRYAHRGLHSIENKIAENTIPAFVAAAQKRFGVELDIRETKDGKLAVIHDSNLKRLCGIDKTVEELTYDELRQLKVLGTEEHPPLFQDVLEIYEGIAPLIIEIKVYKDNVQSLCERALRMLSGYKGDYCIESFDPRAVKWFKDNSPNTVRGQLAANFLKKTDDSGLPYYQRFVLTNLLTNFLTRPDFIAYKYSDRNCLAPRIVCGLFRAQEVSWTIDTTKDLADAEKKGAIPIFERFIP
ncbi:MAG: glycerophosphodiester phosphodiesterase family protein [Clostridiaceae bacterium]|nr:glycerophosphodiester phosphodiesterase family protein [Clostridiaceae bacterium]